MMLIDRPPFPPSTITCSPHLSKSSISSSKEQPWRIFTLATHRTRDTTEEEREKYQNLSPENVDPWETQSHSISDSQSGQPLRQRKPIQLEDLPAEIHQGILDILVGNLNSTLSSSAEGKQVMRNWSNAMRHPRRRQISDLALVSQTWRRMVQERLFRHVKVKGTTLGLEECADWFLTHPHLQQYVRHLEVWLPVWERRAGKRASVGLSGTMTFEQHARTDVSNTIGNTVIGQDHDTINQAYQLASHNSSLDEVFGCVSVLFPAACILTIEGGHCKKPPMIQHFRGPHPTRNLSNLPNIRTLILKGAWNIMREPWHFEIMASALPNIREWHCTYAKPKKIAYQTICMVLRQFPPTLTHLNICLEGFYTKDSPSHSKMGLLQIKHHLCQDLGRIVPQLEALTFTGRVCSCLFKTAIEAAGKVRKPRLKSVDLIVKNCCRELSALNDGTGIHHWGFIKAFEALTTTSVRSLQTYPDLAFLRIRFIDLDSPCPLLNPYFQLENNVCTGIWNEDILSELSQVRPAAAFAVLDEELGYDVVRKEGRMLDGGWPRQRPMSIKVASYATIAEIGIHIQ